MTDPSTDEHTLLGLMTKLDFIADIRAAAGDREGRLMQAELVEHIRGLKARADQAEQLRTEMDAMKGACIPTREDAERQQWKGVDGAIAFHLIDRHADSWDEAARMMHAWRDANPPAEVEALRSDAEWKLTAESLPEDGRLVLFEVDAKPPSRLQDYDGQVFACRYFAEASRYRSAFGVPGIAFHASRWRYVDPPPAIATRKGEGVAGV